jgi:UDP-N-acetylglucosamine:LPS N-acetylglucosamine transferase
VHSICRKILLPCLSAGLGHLILAQAIAHYLRRMRLDWHVQPMDAARDLNDELLRRTFVDMWKVSLKMPPFLSSAFPAMDRVPPRLVRALIRRRLRAAVPKAAAHLTEQRPDLTMSTHGARSHLFSLAMTEPGIPRIPHFYPYGELRISFSVAKCEADLSFTLSPRVQDGLARIENDRARMRHVPAIDDPHIAASEVPRDVLRRGLGIPEDNRVVVLSLGGEGIGRPIPFIEAFARDVKDASLIVLTGHNADLLSKIRQRIRSESVIAMGYQEDISRIVAAADVLAGKCGGSYAMMAIATGIPLIVTHRAPNERGNMHHVVENGHGWYCPRRRRFAERVSALARDRTGGRQPAGAPASARRRNGAKPIPAAIVNCLA